MLDQLQALHEVKTFLEEHNINYLIIGGIANAVWGRPRVTLDADFKVLLEDLTIDDFVKLVGQKFTFRVQDPNLFLKQTYVAPILASNGVAVDLGLGFLPYEQLAVENAVIIELEGVSFPACTAEDLIIHKAISEREKDWDDIEGVLIRQGEKLDQEYIRHWLEQFAEALERPELLSRYAKLSSRITGE
ncbi:MAG: nucleotidyltransferase [Anaerolineae bacterium]|nr:nucleotidyltransferase [Anaerolineae bacterium]